MSINDLRNQYQLRISREIIRISSDKRKGWEYPNFADGSNKNSVEIAWGIINQFTYERGLEGLSGQTTGGKFEEITRDFLQAAFQMLSHLRPGDFRYLTNRAISEFEQYQHLADLEKLTRVHEELTTILGADYIVTPDIVVSRIPIPDSEINLSQTVIGEESAVANLTPIRQRNNVENSPILHASISCKWTIRSDRSQNSRTEALNLIRNRKGHCPFIAVVTAEPLPSRIASLAYGTGDLDCVYHFALYELSEAINTIYQTRPNEIQDQLDILRTLTGGKRLRDISDLPFDLIT